MSIFLLLLVLGVANSCWKKPPVGSESEDEDASFLLRMPMKDATTTPSINERCQVPNSWALKFVTIISTGATARLYGALLGQYEYDTTLGYYVQSDTENDEPTYLLQTRNLWRVGPNETFYWLFNPIISETLPSIGWHIGRPWNKDSSMEDPTLIILHGPALTWNLECKCESYEVTASGAISDLYQSSHFGVYSYTKRWRNGRPILKNTDGRLMQYENQNNGWLLVLKESHFVIGVSQPYSSPSDVKKWYYFDHSSAIFKPVPVNSLNVTCIPRTQ